MPRLALAWSSLLLVAVLTVSSCGEDGISDLLTFNVGVDIDRETVPGLLPISCDLEDLGAGIPLLLLPFTIDLRAEEELEGEGIIGEFESVMVDEVVLRIVDVPAGDSDDWDFLDSIRFFADDPATPDPPVLVAELDPVPQNVMVIRIPGTDVDIAPIASADQFVVSGEVTGRIPCDEHHFEGEIDFDVRPF